MGKIQLAIKTESVEFYWLTIAPANVCVAGVSIYSKKKLNLSRLQFGVL